MSVPETSRVQRLAEWLEIATAKLTTPAQERIRTEIEAHFAESVESHQMAGFSEAEASLAAVAELGDPHAAAKRFRKRHLTEKEAQRIGAMPKYLGRPGSLVMFYITDAFLYFFYLHLLRRYHAPVVFPVVVVVVVMCAVLQTINFFKARRKSSNPDIRLLLLIRILILGCLLLINVWLGIWTEKGPGFGLSIYLTILLVSKLRLWSKLGYIDAVCPETPSRS